MESPFRADVLRGKAALVTGGGSGIGFEIATQLARHGAQVALMGRRREVLDKAVAALRSEGLRVRRLLPTLPTTTTVLVFLRSRSARVSLKDCCFMLGTRQLGENLLFCWQVLLVKMGIR